MMNIYSDNSDYSDIEVTDRDLFEFDAWINGKKITPQLLSRFKNKKDYQEFMTRYEDDHLNIHNDPAIIGNSNKTHISSMNEKFYAKGGKCPESGCVQKKKNGKWMVISNKTGKPWNAEYDTEEKAKAAIAAYHAQKRFSRTFSSSDNISFSTESVPFDWNNPEFSLGDLIGSVMFSVTYTHLFHLGTNKYHFHIALNEYYDKMPALVDAIAEHAILYMDDMHFTNRIIPGDCPIEYLNELLKYCRESARELISPDESGFLSQLDDVIGLIESTLYKLERLDGGHKVYSLSDDTFSDENGLVIIETSNPKQLSKLIELIRDRSSSGNPLECTIDTTGDPKYWRWDGSDSINDIQVEDTKRVSLSKSFSKINSDEDFRKYAHTIMKNAHKNKYIKELTDKVVDDLLEKYPNASYGELIGRLTSGLGNKSK
jgi:hypothetical protein